MYNLTECLFGRAPYASRSFKELEEKIWDPKPIEVFYKQIYPTEYEP